MSSVAGLESWCKLEFKRAFSKSVRSIRCQSINTAALGHRSSGFVPSPSALLVSTGPFSAGISTSDSLSARELSLRIVQPPDHPIHPVSLGPRARHTTSARTMKATTGAGIRVSRDSVQPHVEGTPKKMTYCCNSRCTPTRPVHTACCRRPSPSAAPKKQPPCTPC